MSSHTHTAMKNDYSSVVRVTVTAIVHCTSMGDPVPSLLLTL